MLLVTTGATGVTGVVVPPPQPINESERRIPGKEGTKYFTAGSLGKSQKKSEQKTQVNAYPDILCLHLLRCQRINRFVAG
jgi:hypothetical protein